MKNLTVAEIMTTPVLTVPEEWPLDRLASFFVDNHVSGAPVVVESGEIVGVVSMSDIVRHSSVPESREGSRDTHEYYLTHAGRRYTDEEMRGFRIEPEDQIAVRDLMTPMLFAVAEDASAEEVIDMTVTGGIHRVLVTREKRLTGIVTALGLLKAVRETWRNEEETESSD
jgi:CBS domain-containing protein